MDNHPMTPTPSPAPQWAKDAAEELVYPHGTPSRSVERRLENTSDHEDTAAKIGQIAVIITKHAAAISEENDRLKREAELQATRVIEREERLEQMATSWDATKAQLTALRQWSEQAREVLGFYAGRLRPDENGYEFEQETFTGERARALLATHPAKGMEGRG